ncbi:MAG TPA: hypothetical protein VK363_09515 [Pyrinomonadaceae bacterium]|nr:hypothetical protein [Pyrinomonadaceae bacterium]
MHDCRQTQDNLVDLIFDEADAALTPRLLTEVEACAACGAQYQSLKETLAICDEAKTAAAPRESYWPQYHQALRRRLLDAARDVPATATLNAPFRMRLFTTSVRVPAPLAAAAVVLLVASSVLSLTFALRPAPEPVMLAAPNTPHVSAPQIKFIEVPVVEEKIITQTIYLPRRGNNMRGDASRENLAGVRRQNNAPPDTSATRAPARANLSGFKPAGEVNLRIIKGSDAREQ